MNFYSHNVNIYLKMIAQEIILLDFAFLFTYSMSAFLMVWRVSRDFINTEFVRMNLMEESREFRIIEREVKRTWPSLEVYWLRNN